MGAFKSNRKLGIIVNASNLKLEAFHQSHTRIPSENEASALKIFGNQEDKPSQEICQKAS